MGASRRGPRQGPEIPVLGWGLPPSPGLAPAARAAGETLLTCPELLSMGWAPEHMLSGAAGAARAAWRSSAAPSLTRSLAGTHAGADSCAGADKGSHKETIEERDKRQQRQQRQRHHQGCGAAGSGSDSPTSGPHPVPILFPVCPEFRRAAAATAATPEGTRGCWPGRDRGRKAPAGPSSWGQMPIEIVCKIKFAEEDAKPKEKEAGDEQSLLGAAQGAAAPRDLATFASTSTLHGLGRACGPGPHGLRRTLWALALLTSLAAFLYQAAGLARGYLTRPHLVVMDPAAPAPVAGFPAVTLCNINRFRHSALSDADIFHLANLTGLPPKDRDGHRAAGLRYPEPDMVDILNRTGHQLADMLKSCNFSGHHCSASNFSVVSPPRRPGQPGVARGWQWGWGWRSGHPPRQGFPSFHRQRLASCHPPAWCFPRGSPAGSGGRSWWLTQRLLLLLHGLSCCRSAWIWGAGGPGMGPGVPEASQLAGEGCTRP